METILLKIIYVLYQVVTVIIRRPYREANKRQTYISDKKTTLEKSLLMGAFGGILLVPAIYVFTPFLDVFNYHIPSWLQVLGVLFLMLGGWIFYHAHKDLGNNWSADLEIRRNHTLVTNGIYKKIRHPMYTAIWVAVLAQALVLNNYIAGLSGIVGFGLLYFFRIHSEEQMMLEAFGEQYEVYMKRSTRLVPFLF